MPKWQNDIQSTAKRPIKLQNKTHYINWQNGIILIDKMAIK